MDIISRNQYLQTLIQQRGYHLKPRKEKSQLLDEYCQITGQNRKYVIRKIREGRYLDSWRGKRKPRKPVYDGFVVAALAKIWEIFDYPCGQRLKPLLEAEVERLRELGEVKVSAEVALKLKQISPSTIDRKLKHQREVLRLRRNRHPGTQNLLYQKIPIKLMDEWDRKELGNLQLDFVAHCGSSTGGDFINSLSLTDIGSSWWEGQAIMGRSQRFTHQALEKLKERLPFPIKEIHPDNDSGIINQLVFRWTCERGIKFSRSRPNNKNDNAYVEQKNWSCVRKHFGYLRYDTEEELTIINDLYENELRLYQNFFQPVIRLIGKERIGGRIKRRYDMPRTPYQRLMDSGQIAPEKKRELLEVYLSLNPAQLKRNILAKLGNLYQIHQKKRKGVNLHLDKKIKPRMVTNYMRKPEVVSVT
jgi:hypothetical protein